MANSVRLPDEKCSLMLKINWSNFYIEYSDFLGHLSPSTKVIPKKYLERAKQCRMEGTETALIDSLSNSKRAIDCQVDNILLYLGYSIESFGKDSKTEYVKEFVSSNASIKSIDGRNLKIQFLESLGLIPHVLISKTRYRRNILEHEYETVTDEIANEAIEIAELFIGYTHYRLSILFSIFYIGNDYGPIKYKNLDFTSSINFFLTDYLHISIDRDTLDIRIFKVEVTNTDSEYKSLDHNLTHSKTSDIDDERCWIIPESDSDLIIPHGKPQWIIIISCLIKDDFTMFPSAFNCSISPKNVRYTHTQDYSGL